MNSKKDENDEDKENSIIKIQERNKCFTISASTKKYVLNNIITLLSQKIPK